MVRYTTLLAVTFFITGYLPAQNYAFVNGQWWQNGAFTKKAVYTRQGVFTFQKPQQLDSTIDLQGSYCIPPFGDAHTHNLDAPYRVEQLTKQYLQEGVFYVQVLGNYGSGAVQVRRILNDQKTLEVTYANGLLTATYGHGFYPYEPLAMGIYSPQQQMKLVDSVKKSRLAENNAYFHLDSIADVEKKWPLIMRYKPDHIKICLLDAADYAAKRKAEVVETYGLSPEVAAYVVKKAHAAGLRVFAHVETADDARLCAAIGVDALAHLPGYGWNGDSTTREKYCITATDIALFKKVGLTVIPTANLDNTTTYTEDGRTIENPNGKAAAEAYKIGTLRALYKAKVPMALGADYYGKTVQPEIDYLIGKQVFNNATLIDLWGKQTVQHIFPKRKLGEIKEGFEASFLILAANPLKDIKAISKINGRIKNGQFIQLP